MVQPGKQPDKNKHSVMLVSIISPPLITCGIEQLDWIEAVLYIVNKSDAM